MSNLANTSNLIETAKITDYLTARGFHNFVNTDLSVSYEILTVRHGLVVTELCTATTIDDLIEQAYVCV